MTEPKRKGVLSGQMSGGSVSVASGAAIIVALVAAPPDVQGIVVGALTPVFSYLLPNKLPWKK